MIDARGQVLLFDPPPAIPGFDRARAIARRAVLARTAKPRQPRNHGPRSSQWSAQMAMPATILECRGGPGSSIVAEFIADFGACPVLRCRHNLALWVRENGSIKVEGGHVRGGTLHHNRRVRGESIDQRMDRMADLVVELADRLGTLCVFDLLPAKAGAAGFDARRVHLSYEQIGRVLAQSKEAARKIVDGADESADFAEARLRREQMRARKEVARLVDAAAQERRGRARGQLVQIRPRPPR